MTGSRASSLVLLCISLAIGYALCELILFYYYAGSRGDNLEVSLVPAFNSPLIYTRKPNQVAKVVNKINHVNNAGFRRLEPTLETPPTDIVRVLSYGDSIGHGFGVEDGEQYTDRLEALLNTARETSRWEVLSTFRGSSPGIYSFHIRVDQPRFRPDWVMMEIEMQNDLTDEALLRLGPRDSTGLPHAVHGSRYAVSLEGLVVNNLSSSLPFFSRTLVYSNLVSFIGRIRSSLARNPLFQPGATPYYYNIGSDRYLLTESTLDEAFDEMFETIRAIQRFVEAHHARFLLLLIPGRDAFAQGTVAEAPRRLFQRAVAKSVDLRIPHVDAYPYLEEAGGKELFIDFCHPNRRGHEAIARALYAFFSGQIAFRPQATGIPAPKPSGMSLPEPAGTQ
jgi:lysophospholipase L1-like esterase